MVCAGPQMSISYELGDNAAVVSARGGDDGRMRFPAPAGVPEGAYPFESRFSSSTSRNSRAPAAIMAAQAAAPMGAVPNRDCSGGA